MQDFLEISTHSTRLFPKGNGGAAYQVRGIAARCDLAIMTDGELGGPEAHVHGDLSRGPRTIFLSMRSFYHAIPYFFEEILPRLSRPFVLITGSEDITLPNQIDARFRPFSKQEKGIIDSIIADDRLIHWFAENRDQPKPKMSTLPIGYHPGRFKFPLPQLPIRQRELKVMCAHRAGPHPQYEDRRRVTRFCLESFSDYSTVLQQEVPYEDFFRTVQDHPFVFCVHGGGLDPSPKAWGCIAYGSIPIIRSSVLDDAYAILPVAFVDDWRGEFLTVERLRGWIEELAPYYECPRLRAQTAYRLSGDFWWRKILDALDSNTSPA